MKLMRLCVVLSMNVVIWFDLWMKDISDCLLVEIGKVKMGKGEYIDEYSLIYFDLKSFDELLVCGCFWFYYLF